MAAAITRNNLSRLMEQDAEQLDEIEPEYLSRVPLAIFGAFENTESIPHAYKASAMENYSDLSIKTA